MGDMNAKIGKANKGYETIMGIHGLRKINDNGERFNSLCATHDLIIGAVCFRIKKCIEPHGFRQIIRQGIK